MKRKSTLEKGFVEEAVLIRDRVLQTEAFLNAVPDLNLRSMRGTFIEQGYNLSRCEYENKHIQLYLLQLPEKIAELKTIRTDMNELLMRANRRPTLFKTGNLKEYLKKLMLSNKVEPMIIQSEQKLDEICVEGRLEKFNQSLTF